MQSSLTEIRTTDSLTDTTVRWIVQDCRLINTIKRRDIFTETENVLWIFFHTTTPSFSLVTVKNTDIYLLILLLSVPMTYRFIKKTYISTTLLKPLFTSVRNWIYTWPGSSGSVKPCSCQTGLGWGPPGPVTPYSKHLFNKGTICLAPDYGTMSRLCRAIRTYDVMSAKWQSPGQTADSRGRWRWGGSL